MICAMTGNPPLVVMRTHGKSNLTYGFLLTPCLSLISMFVLSASNIKLDIDGTAFEMHLLLF